MPIVSEVNIWVMLAIMRIKSNILLHFEETFTPLFLGDISCNCVEAMPSCIEITDSVVG
jgi:hypothetical protein